MNQNNFEWESKAQRQNEKLARGKKLYERLLKHDEHSQYHNGESDPVAIDDFFDSLTSAEHAELQAYTAYINANPAEHKTERGASLSLTPTATPDHLLLDAFSKNQEAQTLRYRGIEHTGIPLSRLLDSYIRKKARKAKPVKTKMDKGLYDMETEIERFIMFMGDIKNEDLNKALLEERYISQRQFLPNMVHRNPLYMNGKEPKIDRLTGAQATDRNGKPLEKPIYKSINNIIAFAKSDQKTKFNTPRTVNNEFSGVATFLRIMEESGYIEKGIADYLIKNRLEDDDDTTVIPFTTDELKLIFNNNTYENGLLFDRPHRHWLPLISLYHGNRIGEMAMLYVDDLIQMGVRGDDGSTRDIWVFVIQRNDERKQTRKNKQSARIVPVHQALIDLGLINYRQQLVDSGERQLFPQEKPTGGNNWGNNTSIWFNNSHDGNTKHGIGYAEWCGVEKRVVIDGVEKKKVFHSLRKNWSTQAKRLKLDPDVRRELTGHGEGRKLDVHAKTYEGSYELLEHKRQLDEVHFDLDITKIKKWQ